MAKILPLPLTILALMLAAPVVDSFSPAFLPALRLTNPFQQHSLELETPDFQSVFDKIQQVSPLAATVIQRNNKQRSNDITSDTDASTSTLKWKTVEKQKSRDKLHIEKLDAFNGIQTPVLRFRCTLKGPCVGEFFGRFIMDLEERKKWDQQIERVDQMHEVLDLDCVNIAMGFGRYGDCSRFGVGYGQTKAGLGITPREQMFLYGLQDFADGSSLIWGTEMDEKYDHLLPEGKRHTRAKSHLFSATLTPNDDGSFNIEYVLQLEIGGKLPGWLTTPVVIDTVKNLFETLRKEFSGEGGSLDAFLGDRSSQEDVLANRLSILTAI